MRRTKGTDLAGAKAVTGIEGGDRAHTKDGEVTLGIETGTVRTKAGETIRGIEEAAQHLEQGGEVTDLGLIDTSGDPDRVPGPPGTVAGPIAQDLEGEKILG